MPRLFAVKHPFWTGRILRIRLDAPRITRFVYVRVAGTYPYRHTPVTLELRGYEYGPRGQAMPRWTVISETGLLPPWIDLLPPLQHA